MSQVVRGHTINLVNMILYVKKGDFNITLYMVPVPHSKGKKPVDFDRGQMSFGARLNAIYFENL